METANENMYCKVTLSSMYFSFNFILADLFFKKET